VYGTEPLNGALGRVSVLREEMEIWCIYGIHWEVIMSTNVTSTTRRLLSGGGFNFVVVLNTHGYR
jgi:hypothetical protein